MKKTTPTKKKKVAKTTTKKAAAARKSAPAAKKGGAKKAVKPAAKTTRAAKSAPAGRRKVAKETNLWPLAGLIIVVMVFLLGVGLHTLRRLKGDVLPPNAHTDNALAIAQNKWLWIRTVADNDAEVKPRKADAFILSFALDGSLITRTDCNGGRGTYEVRGKRIAISPLISTLMFCNNSQEGDFNNQLQNVSSVEIKNGMMMIGLGGSLENWTMEFRAIDESLPISWQSNVDAEEFAQEYPMVSEINPFVYADERQMLNLFDESLAQTGMIFFGFPTCPWCQTMLPELMEMAKEMKVEKILYYNPSELRDSGSGDYAKLLGYIGEYLNSDEEGNPRLFVPDVYFVREGEIVGHHLGTLESQTDVNRPLTEEQKTELRRALGGLMGQTWPTGAETR
ncbi:META domain-containing protein [Microgenomates group bacterium]|nr:META domain-containing protein [Microgenomates group bacterium]